MSAKNTTRLDPARQLLTPACFKKQTFVAGPRRPVPPAFPVAARKKTVHTYLQRSPAASDFATFKCADTSRDNLRHSRQRGGAYDQPKDAWEVPMRVLVADDDDFIRELVGIFLEGSGLAMVEAEDGLEAIAEFERQPFRIALIDVMMPKQDGIETIAQVRRRWPSTRIIAMSAGSRLIKRDDALAWASGLGADAVVQKPFDPIMLSDIIERQLALAPPPSQRLAC